MGIVIKQSIRSSAFAYLGVLIGYINLLWLFPYFLSTEEVGLLRLVGVSAGLLATFGQLGLPQTTIRFFPEYKENKGFFAFVRLTGLLGFVILLLFALIFKNAIVDYFSEKSALFIDYFEVTLLISLFLIQFQIMEAFSRSHLKTIAPIFVRDVQLRAFTTLAVVLYGFEVISFDNVINILAVIYASLIVSMVIYLTKNKILKSNLDFSFLKGGNLNKLTRFGLYSLIGAGGSQIVLYIDSVMVSKSMGLGSNGIYTIAFFIGMVIEMPKRSILQVVSPLISQSFKKSDIAHVRLLYKQASINQFIIGGLLLLGVWINLDNIYAFIPNKEEYIGGMSVVLFIGLGKLSDMLFGPNGEIIVMSRYYRINVVLVGILAVATIILNQQLIPIYGMEGAAISSFIAILGFNLLKWAFVYYQFKMQPFSVRTLIYMAILVLGVLVNQSLPVLDNHIIDLLMRSAIASILILGLAYVLKVSAEMNELIHRLLEQAGLKKKA